MQDSRMVLGSSWRTGALSALAVQYLSCSSAVNSPSSSAPHSEEERSAADPADVSSDEVDGGEPKPLPIPAELQSAIRQAEGLGLTLFELDKATARAQDGLHVRLGIVPQEPLPNVLGWVTSFGEGQVQVDFVGGREEALVVLYRSVSAVDDGALAIELLKEPEPLSPSAESQFWAMQTAAKQPFQRCSPSYNGIVVPASLVGKEGWLVYMVASSTRLNEAFLVGHHRFLVSDDGKSVLQHDALSKSCLTFEWPEANPPEMFHLSHIVSEVPGEIYVFANLLYKTPINLLAVDRREGWLIYRGGYNYLGKIEEPTRKAQ